jgi:hypothetical protein
MSFTGSAARWLSAGGAIVLATYFLWIRPWHLHWGAGEEEIVRSLPGDETVKRPGFVATRAVTINASPENIWPWLVQVGCKRAGWYSYDWIDNLGKPSAEQIIAELQNLQPGDTIPMSPNGTGYPGEAYGPESLDAMGNHRRKCYLGVGSIQIG